jgi:hypothetical protein
MLCIFLRADGHFGPDFCVSGLEGDLEPELVVDGCLLGGGGVADEVAQVSEAGDEGADVVGGERPAGLVPGLGGVAGEGGGAVGLDLAGPSGDGLRVAAGVEGGLVVGELCVAVGDDGPGVGGGDVRLGGPGGGGWAASISRMVWSRRCGAKMADSQRSMAGTTSGSRR